MDPDQDMQTNVIGPLRERDGVRGPLPPHDTVMAAIYFLTAPGGVLPAAPGVLAPRAFLELYSPEADNYGPDDFANFRGFLERRTAIGADQAVTFTSLNVEAGQLKIIKELNGITSLPCYLYYENGQERHRVVIQNTEDMTVLDRLKHWARYDLQLQFRGG